MILPASEITDDRPLETEFCIIGSGPAAICMALELSAAGHGVVMIAGGGIAESAADRDLYRGGSNPAGSHEPLEENRRRQLGGTSTAWGGRCIPFEPIDFEKREWVPESGWPFSYEELQPYYRKAAELCKIGEFVFDAREVFPNSGKEVVPGFDGDLFVSHPLERWSPPVNFAVEYRSLLEESDKIKVLLGTHLLELGMEEGPDRISHAEVAAGEKRITVRSRHFILATGGIETPRLLLASANEYFPNGLGNQNDNVGRYYMSHLFGAHALVNPADRRSLILDFEMDNGVYCRRRWWLTDSAQEQHRLLNTIFFLYRSGGRDGHRDGLFSAMFVAKSFLAIVREKGISKKAAKGKELWPGIRQHLGHVITDGLPKIPLILSIAFKRMSKRRLPYMLPERNTPHFGLFYQAEQTPCRESRITLSATEKDAFGMPRAEVSIRFNPQDLESIVKAHELFVARFREKNLGEIIHSTEDFRACLADSMPRFNSSAHHIGTARMAADPKSGVVDENAKVHGIANLHIAGSAVFPTGGHANPTLTILAQALRLAEHLKG